jgi:threonine/homoserine/homoserine lactone efflux protein
MLHYLSIGIMLGLSAGFSPGPLLMLVISETLNHGTKSGVRVALSPILTDLPIILLSTALLSGLSGYHEILGAIALTGGLFILANGYQSLRTQGVELALPGGQAMSLRKGVVTNFLSPHPYLFWIGVGAPLLSKALGIGPGAFLAFIGGFYLALVGAKVLLAVAVGRSRKFLSSRLYIYTMRLLGVLLVVFALKILWEGGQLLGWVS